MTATLNALSWADNQTKQKDQSQSRDQAPGKKNNAALGSQPDGDED
jgi:hypothetical protein